MNALRTLILAATMLTPVSFASSASASNGVFDKLDPCVEQVDTFRDQRDAYLRTLNRAVADADSAALTPEYRDAWMKAKRSALRETFDALVAPALKEARVDDVDAEYPKWFDAQLAKVGAENLDKIITVNFRRELKEVRIQQRGAGTAEVESAKQTLDKECKMDVGNQALRGIITTVLGPIAMVGRNLEIAKRESGELAKPLAATTGISVDAINKNGGVFGGGLSGGESSFFRKNLGIRF
jgi:hypothetical protein